MMTVSPSCVTDEVPEVEADVLAVALAPDALLEQRAVGGNLEVIGLVLQVLGGFRLAAQGERDQMFNKLVRRQERFGAFGRRRFKRFASRLRNRSFPGGLLGFGGLFTSR